MTFLAVVGQQLFQKILDSRTGVVGEVVEGDPLLRKHSLVFIVSKLSVLKCR